MPIDLKNKVAIIGAGCTRFGELYEASAEQLICDAAFEAFADAGVEPGRIEAASVGTVMSQLSGDALGDPLHLHDIPITLVQNYCASGMDAFRNAAMAVAGGMCDVAWRSASRRCATATRWSTTASARRTSSPWRRTATSSATAPRRRRWRRWR